MRIHHATVAKAKKFQITLTVEDNEIVATGKTGTRLASGLQGNKVLEDAITKQTGKVAKGVAKTARKPKPGVGIPKSQRSKKSTPESLARFTEAYDECEDQDEQDQLHEDDFLVDPDAGDDEGTGGKSVVKAKYKAKYKPTKNRCGDELSHRMNEHCSREDDAGDMRIDLDALRKFAKANECWVESYASLKSRTGSWNGGMAMMNCNNRLRAKLRRIVKEEERPFDIDKDIVWK